MSGDGVGDIFLEGATGRRLDTRKLISRGLPIDDVTATAVINAAVRRGRYLVHDTTTVAALGCAARVVCHTGLAKGASAAFELLAALDSDAHEGDGLGALALGALAFDPDEQSELVVPEVVLIVNDKNDPICLIQGSEERVDSVSHNLSILTGESNDESPTPPPDRFELIARQSHEEFKRAVAQAVSHIGLGGLDKVVLAREVLVIANQPFRQEDLLGRLRALYPSCATFAIDGFIGASPELLVRREGARVSAHPLAGTVARSGDPEEDARLASHLFGSEKERSEHRFVVDAIDAELRRLGGLVTTPGAPHLLELRNVVHLATRIDADFSSSAVLPSALELAAALHPTPAVGGFPKAAALSYLRANERLNRGCYAGPVGYVRGNGDGEFFLGIRSATIDRNRARLFAGVGIVAGSDPDEELAETQLKLQALLAAAVRP